jgi:hypothetical protein
VRWSGIRPDFSVFSFAFLLPHSVTAGLWAIEDIIFAVMVYFVRLHPHNRHTAKQHSAPFT